MGIRKLEENEEEIEKQKSQNKKRNIPKYESSLQNVYSRPNGVAFTIDMKNQSISQQMRERQQFKYLDFQAMTSPDKGQRFIEDKDQLNWALSQREKISTKIKPKRRKLFEQY